MNCKLIYIIEGEKKIKEKDVYGTNLLNKGKKSWNSRMNIISELGVESPVNHQIHISSSFKSTFNQNFNIIYEENNRWLKKNK